MKAVPIASVDEIETLGVVPFLAFAIWQAVGNSNGLGFYVFGSFELGDDFEQGGIFRRAWTGYNQYTGKPLSKKQRHYVLMRDYSPTYSATSAIVASRSHFADAVAAWQALTPSERQVYNLRTRGKGYTGYHLFIKLHMQEAYS